MRAQSVTVLVSGRRGTGAAGLKPLGVTWFIALCTLKVNLSSCLLIVFVRMRSGILGPTGLCRGFSLEGTRFSLTSSGYICRHSLIYIILTFGVVYSTRVSTFHMTGVVDMLRRCDVFFRFGGLETVRQKHLLRKSMTLWLSQRAVLSILLKFLIINLL